MIQENNFEPHSIGSVVKDLRLKHEWKQSAVAKKLSISIPAFSKIETGATDINVTRLHELANVFSVPVSELVYGSIEPQNEINLNTVEGLRAKLSERTAEYAHLQTLAINLLMELTDKK